MTFRDPTHLKIIENLTMPFSGIKLHACLNKYFWQNCQNFVFRIFFFWGGHKPKVEFEKNVRTTIVFCHTIISIFQKVGGVETKIEFAKKYRMVMPALYLKKLLTNS